MCNFFCFIPPSVGLSENSNLSKLAYSFEIFCFSFCNSTQTKCFLKDLFIFLQLAT